MHRTSALQCFCRCLLVLLGLALSGGALATDASPKDEWAARSDAVFRRVLAATMSITDLAQDKDGFLWVATQSGLGRWDGYKLRNYLSDNAAPGALPDSYLQALRVDSQGRLWIGTNAGGLVRYDAATDRFVSPLAADAALSRNSVFAMLEDGRGGLWVGTGGGLDLLDPLHGTVQRHATLAHLHGLPDGAVRALLRDAAGALWIGTDKGLFRQASSSGALPEGALAYRRSRRALRGPAAARRRPARVGGHALAGCLRD